MTQTLPTLNRITDALQKQGNSNQRDLEKRMHACAMLALVSAAHSVANEYIVPTPLYRLEYNPDDNTLQFEELNGRAKVPRKNAIDVTMLDMIIASMFRDKLSLKFEGITGIGKTHTAEMLLKTVLHPSNYCIIRLSSAMTNVQQPYVEGLVENGVLKLKLKKDALDKIAALFIDEENRGDTNQVLQLKDGKISLSSGETGYLGLPIPRLMQNKTNTPSTNTTNSGTLSWQLDYSEKRPLLVASAQNPSGAIDSKYTGTRGTDAAVKNRDVEIKVPNAVGALGATLLRVRTNNSQHEAFLERFTYALNKYAGISGHENELGNTVLEDEIKKDSSAWFAFGTDPKRTYRQEIRSATELLDVLCLLFSQNLDTEFKHDSQTIQSWHEELLQYKIDFRYSSTLDLSTKEMEKIRKIVGGFSEQEVTRDIIKAKKLADAFSLLRNVKTALAQPKPVESLLNSPSYITVQDVACGYAIMVRDKQVNKEDDPVIVINKALTDYVQIAETFAKELTYKNADDATVSSTFKINDPRYSIYGLALANAIRSSCEQSGTGIVGAITNAITTSFGAKKDSPTEKFIQSLGKSVAILKRVEGASESKKPIAARCISDLTTLAGFVHQYNSHVEKIFEKDKNPNQRLEGFQNLYRNMKQTSSIHPIYLQRLSRVIGV